MGCIIIIHAGSTGRVCGAGSMIRACAQRKTPAFNDLGFFVAQLGIALRARQASTMAYSFTTRSGGT